MKVREAMTTVVHTVTPHCTLNEAARQLWENDCGVVPVLEDGEVVGIVTDRDIAMASYIQNRPLTDLPVTRIMSQQVVSCGPEDDITVAMGLMAERQVRRLPVLDAQGALCGLVSLNDLCRASAAGRLDARSLVKTLAAISTPREAALA